MKAKRSAREDFLVCSKLLSLRFNLGQQQQYSRKISNPVNGKFLEKDANRHAVFLIQCAMICDRQTGQIQEFKY
jgi:hypothetical protein